jgi:hypothetical protein
VTRLASHNPRHPGLGFLPPSGRSRKPVLQAGSAPSTQHRARARWPAAAPADARSRGLAPGGLLGEACARWLFRGGLRNARASAASTGREPGGLRRRRRMRDPAGSRPAACWGRLAPGGFFEAGCGMRGLRQQAPGASPVACGGAGGCAIPRARARRDGTGTPERHYLPPFTGVNLIFLISSTTCPSRTMPDTAVIACTTFS